LSGAHQSVLRKIAFAGPPADPFHGPPITRNFPATTDDTSNNESFHAALPKGHDRRRLPLTEEVVNLLARHQEQQPEGHPYVFVSQERYERIQELRRQGRWSYSDSRLKVLNNFRERYRTLLHRAGITGKTFHDLRRTVLSNWLANGMSEHDVMRLAGHADFATTDRFYLSVADDLLDRGREITACRNLAQIWHKSPSEGDIEKGSCA